MPTLKWIPEALQDLERLILFVAEKNPAASRRAAKTILDAIYARRGTQQLVAHPEIGKPLDDARREWFATFGAGAYVLRYRIDADGNPIVIRIWHSREDRRP